jgi:transposase, IS5 family
MRQFAKLHNITIWWNDDEIRKLWREFSLNKGNNRVAWLTKFNALFISALKIFSEKVNSLKCSEKRKAKVCKLLNLLNLLEEQTIEKLKGKIHIKNRIVSVDEPDARPIKKGKIHPACEFGTTMQMSFNREGFMITIENLIGNPNDKILFPQTFALFKKRMEEKPDTVVTDLGYRSSTNFETAQEINNVFLGRSEDVSEEKQAFCCKARSATEGFIAVAKNLRGFGRSLYRGFKGDRIWSLLCQTAYNLKKFVQLWMEEKIEEKNLVKLGLLT